ncbi:MAG: ATP-binding protein [bacterium]
MELVNRDEFEQENRLHVATLLREWPGLHEAGTRPEAVRRMFRAFHMMKSNAGFLAQPKLQDLAESGENLLETLRRETEPGANVPIELGAVITSVQATLGTTVDAGQEHDPDGLVKIDRESLAQLSGLLDQLEKVAGELRQGDTRPEILRLDRVSRELRETLARSRRRPLDRCLQRLVDGAERWAAETGRTVRIAPPSTGIGLEPETLSGIHDALTQLIRNAVVHGIEAPSVRAKLHKPEPPAIELRCDVVGQTLQLIVRDDGAGIDREAVRKAAMAGGRWTAEELDERLDTNVWSVLATPGLTTAQVAGHGAGRGVGLDIVQIAIARLGGEVLLETAEGLGTTVRLRIPLAAGFDLNLIESLCA